MSEMKGWYAARENYYLKRCDDDENSPGLDSSLLLLLHPLLSDF